MPITPNIYKYATTEYAQDAFIAWMCDNFNCECQQGDALKLTPDQVNARKELAKAFIYFLMGEKIPFKSFMFTKVEVEEQPGNIDVLLTLTGTLNGQKETRYVIIEDKKFSEEHSNQVEDYIKLLNKKGHNESGSISLDKIHVAYYKTGHLSKTDSWFDQTCENGQWRKCEELRKSESNRLTGLRDDPKYKDLASFEIKTLDNIATFFSGNAAGLVRACGSEILSSYVENIKEQWQMYSSTDLSQVPQKASAWARIFDKLAAEKNKEKDSILVDVNFWKGQYWEIRTVHEDCINGSTNNQFAYPVMVFKPQNIASNSFKVIFLNKRAFVREKGDKTKALKALRKGVVQRMLQYLVNNNRQCDLINSLVEAPSKNELDFFLQECKNWLANASSGDISRLFANWEKILDKKLSTKQKTELNNWKATGKGTYWSDTLLQKASAKQKVAMLQSWIELLISGNRITKGMLTKWLGKIIDLDPQDKTTTSKMSCWLGCLINDDNVKCDWDFKAGDKDQILKIELTRLKDVNQNTVEEAFNYFYEMYRDLIYPLFTGLARPYK